jgi:hypothetical protein
MKFGWTVYITGWLVLIAGIVMLIYGVVTGQAWGIGRGLFIIFVSFWWIRAGSRKIAKPNESLFMTDELQRDIAKSEEGAKFLISAHPELTDKDIAKRVGLKEWKVREIREKMRGNG